MTNQKYKNLTIRLKLKEREDLEKQSKEANLNISEYVKSILFNLDEKKEPGIKFDNNSYTDILKEQLKEKDKQILELTKLLDQQQKLLLQEQNKTQLLIEAPEKKKWWIFWKNE